MIAIRRKNCGIEAVVRESKSVKVLQSHANNAHAGIDIDRTGDVLITVLKHDTVLPKGKLTVIGGITIDPDNIWMRILFKKLQYLCFSK